MHAPLPWLMLLCVVMALIAVSIRRIPEGHAYTLRRVGGQMCTVGAGLHLVLPLVERVAHRTDAIGIDHDAFLLRVRRSTWQNENEPLGVLRSEDLGGDRSA